MFKRLFFIITLLSSALLADTDNHLDDELYHAVRSNDSFAVNSLIQKRSFTSAEKEQYTQISKHVLTNHLKNEKSENNINQSIHALAIIALFITPIIKPISASTDLLGRASGLFVGRLLSGYASSYWSTNYYDISEELTQALFINRALSSITIQ